MPRAALSRQELETGRVRLCDAALALYEREGEVAVSFRRIADQTGTSHTRAYRYFEDKAALFAAMRVRCYEQFARSTRQAADAGDSTTARIQALCMAVLDFVEAYPERFEFMFSPRQPALTQYPALMAIRRETFDYFVALIQRAVDEDLLEGDARTLTHVAWAGIYGLFTLHVSGQLVYGRQLRDVYRPMFRRVLYPLFEDFQDHPAATTAGAGPQRRLKP